MSLSLPIIIETLNSDRLVCRPLQETCGQKHCCAQIMASSRALKLPRRSLILQEGNSPTGDHLIFSSFLWNLGWSLLIIGMLSLGLLVYSFGLFQWALHWRFALAALWLLLGFGSIAYLLNQAKRPGITLVIHPLLWKRLNEQGSIQ